MVYTHVLPIRVSFLNTGLYLGSLNPAFIKELGELMAKWHVVHLEAVIVPCTGNQKIEIKVKEGEDDSGCDTGFGP